MPANQASGMDVDDPRVTATTADGQGELAAATPRVAAVASPRAPTGSTPEHFPAATE